MNQYFFTRLLTAGQSSTPGLLAVLMLMLLVLLGPGALVQAQEELPSSTVAIAQATLVDINTADAAQLAEGLNGVGLSKAEAIIRYREQFGAFESIEELGEVQGIGAATIERNRLRIRLR